MRVVFITFSGMKLVIAQGVDREEAQRIVIARNNHARRRGQPVAKVDWNSWEHGEEEGCGMIGDRHGYLQVQRE